MSFYCATIALLSCKIGEHGPLTSASCLVNRKLRPFNNISRIKKTTQKTSDSIQNNFKMVKDCLSRFSVWAMHFIAHTQGRPCASAGITSQKKTLLLNKRHPKANVRYKFSEIAFNHCRSFIKGVVASILVKY
eukprot:1579800-Amphidinium_carterae.2